MLKGCCEFAHTLLTKTGAFYPFGESADASGVRSMVGGYDGEEHPNPREIYELLLGAFREGARDGRISAAALAVDVTVPTEYESPFPDAVRVLIEAPGYSRLVYRPYRVIEPSGLGRFLRASREIEYGEMFSVSTPPQVSWPGV
jgi:hypothetical protein